MKITGAIFDVDGTLLDSLVLWKNIGANYLRSIGKKPKDDIAQTIKFMSLPEAADFFIKDYNLQLTQQQICDGINEMAEEFYYNEAKLKNGVKDFLSYLKNSGVKMCIATATDKYLVDVALKRNGVRDYFEDIFTCTDVGANKSSSMIYDKAHKLIATDKQTTYVFEDMLFAIKTAKNAGYKVAGIYDSFSKHDAEEIKETADVFFKSYDETRDYFD